MIVMKPSPVSIKLASKDSSFNFKLIHRELFSAVTPLYPDFTQWLYFTFRPSFIAGKRDIIVAYSRNELIGLSLIKKDSVEKKICTFYTFPKYRDQQIGFDLMSISMDLLKSNVVITASEDRSHELEPLLNKFNFKCEKKITGYYKENKIENHYRSL
ncbi:hypothetical protein [Vreelandella venusta]|uniref:hypothetical protein n=1 Tax=Vreelandella venusta TaxID=44935 RepID=UPI003F6691FC